MTKKRLAAALLLAFLAMAVSYFSTNLKVSISGEKEVLKYWNLITNILSPADRNVVPDDALFINVSSDKELVDITDDLGIPVGNAAITDRRKLADLLSLIASSEDYRYVLLDVFFEDGYVTEADSALFGRITSMDRIVIPRHTNGQLISPVLEAKAAYADYLTSIKEDNFTKFPLLYEGGISSMPLKIYSDLTGRTVVKKGPLYMDKASVSRKVVFPKMYVKIDSPSGPDGEKTYLNMGADILDVYSTDDADDLFKDKIVVIGSFVDDNHATYAGTMAGCVINYNVLESLLKGQHKIPVVLILVYFLIFFAMSCLLLNKSGNGTQSLAWVWAKLFVVYSVVLTVVCIFVFIIWGQAHDIFITSTLFSIVDTCNRWFEKRGKHA